MFYLKKKVTNKAKVEGSICEAYLIDEITNFAFQHVTTVFYKIFWVIFSWIGKNREMSI